MRDRQRSGRSALAKLWAILALALAVASPLGLSSARSEPRVALVIGNNAYQKVSRLGNAINDASAMAENLSRLGFEVIRVLDGGMGDINAALRRYVEAVGNGGTGVVYFAGHGIQVDGRSYLLPVDFSAADVDRLADRAIPVPDLLDALDRAKVRLSVVILDACRNNPFPAGAQARRAGEARGLSELARPIPGGTLVLYAAGSNQAALDALPGQAGNNGLFTGELLPLLKETGLEIRDLAHKVRFSVMEKARTAGHLQVPALYDNLNYGSFYLSVPRVQPPPVSAGGLPRRITIVAPFAAKGPSDSVLRSLIPFLERELNREIAVENDIDIDGGRVADLVASGPKDGSILMASAFAPSARRFASGDQRLTPLAIFADTPLALFINAAHTATSIPDLLADTRSAHRKLRMTAAPRGSPAHMCAHQFQRTFGSELVDLVDVASEAVAVAEVGSGNADLTCASAAATRPSASRPNSRLREIADIRSTASPVARTLPVQPARAQGFDIVAPNWLGLFAPAGIDPALARQVSTAIAKVQADPAYATSIARISALPVSAEEATPAGLLRVLALAVALQN